MLAPLSGRSGTRALRLIDAQGVDYWLEYRAASGRDAWLGTAADHHGLQAGVLLHRAGALPDTSLLLDGTPVTAAGWDGDLQSALPVGSPVPVAGGTFTVVVRSVGVAGAEVAVTPAPAVAAAAPAPRAAAPAPSVLPGSADEPPATGDTAGFWAAPYEGVRAPRPAPALASASDSTDRGGPLMPLAGAVLAASVLLVVHTMRKRRLGRVPPRG
jgi:hypothetical protein